MSYSQFDEEQHILAAVRDMPTGRVLDIGAGDGVTFSNSRALIERGWGGLLVEPSPEPFQALYKLYRQHPKVELMNGLVGTYAKIVKFHHTLDLLSTTSEYHKAKWGEAGGYDGSYFAPQVSIMEVVKTFQQFDVFSIDVEGGSAEIVFLLFMHEHLLPTRVLCVEHDDDAAELADEGKQYGFRVVYENATNVVMAR
jgi:FkbM family methyltransferase